MWFIKNSTIYSFAGFCNFNINHFETSFCLYEWAQIVSKECIWQHQRGPMGAVYSFRILTEHIKSYFFFSDRKTECTMARFRKNTLNRCFNHENWLRTCKDMMVLSLNERLLANALDNLKRDLIWWSLSMQVMA